jgi:L-fucose isomerase-like protein
MNLGVVAIARPTFDIPFAEETATKAWNTLSAGSAALVGSPELLMETDSVDAAIAAMDGTIDALVVLQATFADSTLVERATTLPVPTVLWAFPEARTGGRLRLNSFCGINLGAYALTNLGRRFGWIYREAADPEALDDLAVALTAESELPAIAAAVPIEAFASISAERATAARDRLRTTTIGRIGDHPDGFEPCGYNVRIVDEVFGTTIDAIPLPLLFERSEAATTEQINDAERRASEFLEGVDTLDQPAVERSLRFNVGLKSLADEREWSGVATRCWPETFTEFGGAMCTPMSLLNDVGVLGTCEADVYGDLTGLAMQSLAGSVAFVADLVHLDRETNTGVFWHCGLAPFDMADPAYPPIATVHSNRKLPLLSEFPLKPGRVTLARFSRSRGVHRLVVGGGEMISAPPSFSGTSGVLRFDRSVDDVLSTVMDEGLEHHFGIVYGDVRESRAARAALLSMPIVEL